MGVITAAKWPFPHFNVPDNQAARRGRDVRPRRGCQTPNYDEMMKERPDGCQWESPVIGVVVRWRARSSTPRRLL